MELTMNTSPSEINDFEALLEAAGFDFVVVDRCPHAACEICAGSQVPFAA
jgi:hypothetical protein